MKQLQRQRRVEKILQMQQERQKRKDESGESPEAPDKKRAKVDATGGAAADEEAANLAHDEAGEFEKLLEDDGEMPVLSHIYKTVDDLMAKDDRQVSTIESFRLKTVHANFMGHPTLMVGRLPRVYKGYFATRIVYKKHIFKQAALSVDGAIRPIITRLLRFFLDR